MTFLRKFYKSQLFIEYESNLRLQWMLVAIIAILALSLSKQVIDILQQERSQTQNQLVLLARLQQTAQKNIDYSIVESIKNAYASWVDALPKAASSSVAEAQALIEIDQQLGTLLKRKRLNLLGSEQLSGTTQVFWQVRIELAGQMTEQDLIGLLQYFDDHAKHARLTSFQYSPKTSNTINLVVDVLYIRAENA
jgi:hypothetical protein